MLGWESCHMFHREILHNSLNRNFCWPQLVCCFLLPYSHQWFCVLCAVYLDLRKSITTKPKLPYMTGAKTVIDAILWCPYLEVWRRHLQLQRSDSSLRNSPLLFWNTAYPLELPSVRMCPAQWMWSLMHGMLGYNLREKKRERMVTKSLTADWIGGFERFLIFFSPFGHKCYEKPIPYFCL